MCRHRSGSATPYPVEEVNSTGCKAALHNMRDVWDVNPSSSSVCAHHDHTLPAHKSWPSDQSGSHKGQPALQLEAVLSCFQGQCINICVLTADLCERQQLQHLARQAMHHACFKLNLSTRHLMLTVLRREGRVPIL